MREMERKKVKVRGEKKGKERTKTGERQGGTKGKKSKGIGEKN